MPFAFTEWLVEKLISCILALFWLALTSPPLLLLIWLRHSHQEYAAVVSWFALPLAVAWLLAGFWLAPPTAPSMFDEKYLFLTALKYTLSDLRCKLALLPVLGHLFTPDEDKTHPEDDVP